MNRTLAAAIASLILVTACASSAPSPSASGVSPAPASPSPDATPASPSPGPDAPIPGIELAMADVPRAAADPADARRIATSVNAFGLDLYREMLGSGLLVRDENAVYSPASVALALSMARAGARGATADEMDDVLQVTGWEELASGLNALDLELANRNATWVDPDGSTRQIDLRIANAAFGQREWEIEAAYLDALASGLGSGLRLVDYRADPEAARQAINAWVSRQTMDRIPELLRPPDVTVATRLYLVNAVYLKAEWERWFDLEGTAPAAFTRLDGSQVEVPMMTRWAGGLGPYVPLARGDGWQAVDLRYGAAPGTPPLAMTVVLPDNLPAFESAFDGPLLAAIVADLDAERASFDVNQCPDQAGAGCYPYDIELFMPRFSIETRADLGATLAAAGMPLAFDPDAADFTGINGTEPVFIKTVIHQANIDVDEKGTEAAAATAVGMDTGGGPSALERIIVRLDRPFLFLLRDVETGAVLFLGRVVDPSITR